MVFGVVIGGELGRVRVYWKEGSWRTDAGFRHPGERKDRQCTDRQRERERESERERDRGYIQRPAETDSHKRRLMDRPIGAGLEGQTDRKTDADRADKRHSVDVDSVRLTEGRFMDRLMGAGLEGQTDRKADAERCRQKHT